MSTRPDLAGVRAVGWGSGDVAENTDWARELAAEHDARMLCRLDRDPARTNDGSRLLWTVYALTTPATTEDHR